MQEIEILLTEEKQFDHFSFPQKYVTSKMGRVGCMEDKNNEKGRRFPLQFSYKKTNIPI